MGGFHLGPERRSLARIFALAALSSAVCGSGCVAEPGDVAAREDAVIYGEDDRREWFEFPDEAIRERARGAAVALVPFSSIQGSGDAVTLVGPSLSETVGLCPGQRFGDQTAPAFCSGVLIDEDLVLTAAHCVATEAACRETALVFDHLYTSPGALAPLARSDLYFCRRVVTAAFEDGDGEARRDDFAVLQLDRPVSAERQPAPLAAAAPSVGEPVLLAGFGGGVPMKISDGAAITVTRAEGDYFEATLDAFAGDSGAAVLTPEGDLVRILARGNADYVSEGGCAVVAVRRDESDAEEVGYSATAVEALCASGWPSEALCASPAACGDGLCSGAETRASCPGDCAGVCGDGVCDRGEAGPGEAGPGEAGPGEAGRCEDDCLRPPPPPPDGWTCPATFYAAGNGCDCGCGRPDPDCDDAAAPVRGCGAAQVCVEAQCVDADKIKSGCVVGPARRAEGPAWIAALLAAALGGLARRRSARGR